MLTVIVRAGSDASAVQSALRPHYGDARLGYEVISAGGVRGESLVRRVVEEASRRRSYVVVLLGREDRHLAGDIMASRPNDLLSVVTLRKRKVRNARMSELLEAVELGKAMIRNSVCWSASNSCYRLGVGGEELDFPKDFVSDPFLIYGRGLKALSMLAGAAIRGSALLVRRESGKHLVFVGSEVVAELKFSEGKSKPEVLQACSKGGVLEGASPECLGPLNEGRLAMMEMIGVEFLRSVSEALGISAAIVPLSGGKDSAAALSIAVKAFGSESVKAVYVDTGVDFKINCEHAETLASMFGVEFSVVRAPVREEIIAGRELPTHSSRWCTRLKIGALMRKCAELAGGRKALVVAGARDSESRARELEPYVGRVGDNLFKVSPVRHWSTIECQAYCIAKGIPLNPLYELGFYRIGCFICPSLRSWERFIMRLFSEDIRGWVPGLGSSNKS